jgi:hypothetical protein
MIIEECVLITPQTTAENQKLLDLHLIRYTPSASFYTFPSYVCDLHLFKNSETIKKKLEEK